jgi:hypothetical protein
MQMRWGFSATLEETASLREAARGADFRQFTRGSKLPLGLLWILGRSG